MNLKELPCYTDLRGSIQTVFGNCVGKLGSVTWIESKENTERASHYHLGEEGHWILITGGEIWIYERPVGSDEIPTKTILKVDDLHWTGPNVEHTMYFPERNSFLCFSVLPRDSESYENNTVRIPVSLKSIYDAAPYQNG